MFSKKLYKYFFVPEKFFLAARKYKYIFFKDIFEQKILEAKYEMKIGKEI